MGRRWNNFFSIYLHGYQHFSKFSMSFILRRTEKVTETGVQWECMHATYNSWIVPFLVLTGNGIVLYYKVTNNNVDFENIARKFWYPVSWPDSVVIMLFQFIDTRKQGIFENWVIGADL